MENTNFQRALGHQLKTYLEIFPCVAIVGPRQVGKTHLVKSMRDQYDRESIYLDLESDEDLVKLSNAEQYFNSRQDKLIIIDEIQRKPKLFALLRSVIDKKRENGRFILLGSASPDLLTRSSESLAGRIGYLEMQPLMYEEVKGVYSHDRLWLRGGFPNALIEVPDAVSMTVRQQFVQTYVERELAILGLSASSTRLKN
ncbi:MAG: ATP-binding protein, partial [Cryomorphaceae bacterium]